MRREGETKAEVKAQRQVETISVEVHGFSMLGSERVVYGSMD